MLRRYLRVAWYVCFLVFFSLAVYRGWSDPWILAISLLLLGVCFSAYFRGLISGEIEKMSDCPFLSVLGIVGFLFLISGNELLVTWTGENSVVSCLLKTIEFLLASIALWVAFLEGAYSLYNFLREKFRGNGGEDEGAPPPVRDHP